MSVVYRMQKMKQKFEALRQESYLIFMDACDAWHESPLFKDYLASLEETINKSRKLIEVLAEKKKLTAEEMRGIVKLNKFLEP